MSFAIPFAPTDPPAYRTSPGGAIRGSLYPQLQLQTVKFDPVRGYSFRYKWDGASQDQMQPVWQECVNAGMIAELTFQRDMGFLEVSDPTSEFTIDSWEIHASEETRDLFSLPAIVAAVANQVAQIYGSLGPTGITQLMADDFSAIRTHLAANDLWSNVENDVTLKTLLADPIAGPMIAEFYALYQEGTTGYRCQAYVLKHKTNVSNRWQANIADVGIDNVYTLPQLLSEVTNPGLWVFPLPARLVYKLAAIPPLPQSDTAPGNYLSGWLKSSSTEITEAWNRINIETDYTFDLWNTDIYPQYGE